METYQQLFTLDEGPLIFPQEAFTYDFHFAPVKEREYRLFFTGETEMFYYWKTESCATPLYKRISDSLVRGERSAFALQFRGAEYQLLCGRKILWPATIGGPMLMGHTETWKLGVYAKGKDIFIHPEGYLRLTLEIRYKKENLLKNHTKFAPDKVYTIDFPEGSYNYKDFFMDVEISNEDTANVCYYLEGENFSGEILFESPFLISSNGYNIMPSFAPDSSLYQDKFNWAGVNLSRAEWPQMEILLNGKVVFEGEFFERCHRYSEKEFRLPEHVLNDGSNQITFRVTTDGHDPLPYRLHEIGIVSEAQHSFDIVSCPEIVTVGEEFALLLSLQQPCTLTLSSEAEAMSDLQFREGGLHYLRLRCMNACNNLSIQLSDDMHMETCVVSRVLQRGYDNVVTGTGDLVYVNQDITDTTNYLKWYLQNNIGKLLTIRPTYRWSGTRKLQKKTWEKMIDLLNGLGMEYSHMIDGREPAGMTANPSLQELSADTTYPSKFLGRQMHELDGAYCYWGHYEKPEDYWNINDFYDTELIFDQALRLYRDDTAHAGGMDLFYPEDIFDDGERYWLCHDPSLPADMEVHAKAVMNNMRTVRNGSTRHTGPSIFFKYFCMAGYDWVGAETMYSPTEFLMAALRGASRAFHLSRMGVHHAVQWSSSPHDDEMRFRRYRLALYVSWMQGAHEINTEEGLWHMEAGYVSHHRFSYAAKEHLKVQQDFARYVASHTRRGRLHTPVAVLHGRYDGAPCFSAGHVWGQSQQVFSTEFDAECGWLIPKRSYFPIDVNGWNATKHHCLGGPIGLVSGNPRGNFDIVPVEMPVADDYQLMAFFSYNKAEVEDMDRILERVRDGATLMLTLAHLSDTTDRADIEHYRLHFSEQKIFEVLGYHGVPTFVEDTYEGKQIPVANNSFAEEAEILYQTDSGRILVTETKVGKGKIVLFHTKLYPANPAICPIYTAEFEKRVDALNKEETVMPLVDSAVQAVVYNQEDGTKEVYFLAVDWWNVEDYDRQAALRVGNHTYNFYLPFGVMKKVLINGDMLIWGDSESADVLSMNNENIVLQGSGVERYHIACNGQEKTISVDFTGEAIQVIKPTWER